MPTTPVASGSSQPEGDEAAIARLKAIPGLDPDAALYRLRGKTASYLRLLQLFSNEHCDDTARVQAELAAGRQEEARRIAHSLKGAAGMLGATSLQEAASLMEQAILGNPEAGDVASRTTALEGELGRILGAVAGALAPTSAAIDWAAARSVFLRLGTLLAEGDIQSDDLFRHHSELLRQLLGGDYAPIERLIAAYDFEAALQLLLRAGNRHRELTPPGA